MTTTLHFNPSVIAHRGASAYAPENTLAAFTKAIQLGCKWIEFDVMLAADGEPVIFHDDLLDRTTNASGDLEHHSFPFLRTLDAGGWFDLRFSGETIPSLQQVIHFLENNNLCANVEIKPTPGTEFALVERAVAMLAQSAIAPSRLLFSSFSPLALTHIRECWPACQMGLLLHEWEQNWQALCQSLQCVSVHVNEEIMTKAHAREIKEMGKKLLCYTVNDPERAKVLFNDGVDAVFSDVPDLIMALNR